MSFGGAAWQGGSKRLAMNQVEQAYLRKLGLTSCRWTRRALIDWNEHSWLEPSTFKLTKRARRPVATAYVTPAQS